MKILIAAAIIGGLYLTVELASSYTTRTTEALKNQPHQDNNHD